MEQSERLQAQMNFLLTLDREKQIGRQSYLADGSRHETDAEHAWHLAVMVLLLAEYANEPIDILRTVSMVLLHDVVEIYAGDTYAYDEEAKKTQAAREENAAKRLYRLLPSDQRERLYALWQEFEEAKTPEAKFARTMDNVQPVMLNHASGGKAWAEHQVKLSQIMGRQSRTPEGSAILWKMLWQSYIAPHCGKEIINDSLPETEGNDEPV